MNATEVSSAEIQAWAENKMGKQRLPLPTKPKGKDPTFEYPEDPSLLQPIEIGQCKDICSGHRTVASVDNFHRHTPVSFQSHPSPTHSRTQGSHSSYPDSHHPNTPAADGCSWGRIRRCMCWLSCYWIPPFTVRLVDRPTLQTFIMIG